MRQIQCLLAYLGYDPGAIDGIQGKVTRGAVQRFQAREGLSPDGIAGEETRKALLAAVAAGRMEEAPKDTGGPDWWREIRYFKRNEPYIGCSCGRCGGYFVAEADGSLYPCDFYVLDQWKLGTLDSGPLETLRSGADYRRFLDLGARPPEKCRACQWGRLCRGGCKNDWIWQDGVPENHYCASFQALFRYALPRMLRIAREEARQRQRP